MADATDNRELFVTSAREVLGACADVQVLEPRDPRAAPVVICVRRNERLALVTLSEMESQAVLADLIPSLAAKRAHMALAYLGG